MGCGLVGGGLRLFFGEAGKALGDAVEQGVNAGAVFRRNGEDVGDAQFVELAGEFALGGGFGLIDGERNRLAEALEHLGEVAVGARDFGAAVHQEDDMGGAAERHLRLVENLRRDVLLVVDDDTAGVDQLEAPAVVFGKPMNPVARDAGLIADNGAPLSGNPIE